VKHLNSLAKDRSFAETRFLHDELSTALPGEFSGRRLSHLLGAPKTGRKRREEYFHCVKPVLLRAIEVTRQNREFDISYLHDYMGMLANLHLDHACKSDALALFDEIAPQYESLLASSFEVTVNNRVLVVPVRHPKYGNLQEEFASQPDEVGDEWWQMWYQDFCDALSLAWCLPEAEKVLLKHELESLYRVKSSDLSELELPTTECHCLLTKPFMRRYKILPVRIEGVTVTIAMVNPNDHDARVLLDTKFADKYKTEFRVCTEEGFWEFFKRIFPDEQEP
jgi:hypothetical protein